MISTVHCIFESENLESLLSFISFEVQNAFLIMQPFLETILAQPLQAETRQFFMEKIRSTESWNRWILELGHKAEEDHAAGKANVYVLQVFCQLFAMCRADALV